MFKKLLELLMSPALAVSKCPVTGKKVVDCGCPGCREVKR